MIGRRCPSSRYKTSMRILSHYLASSGGSGYTALEVRQLDKQIAHAVPHIRPFQSASSRCSSSSLAWNSPQRVTAGPAAQPCTRRRAVRQRSAAEQANASWRFRPSGAADMDITAHAVSTIGRAALPVNELIPVQAARKAVDCQIAAYMLSSAAEKPPFPGASASRRR